MISKTLALALAGATLLAACSGEQPATTNTDAMVDNGVSLRNLAETEVAVPKPEQLTVKGRLIPTPFLSPMRVSAACDRFDDRKLVCSCIVGPVFRPHGAVFPVILDIHSCCHHQLTDTNRPSHLIGQKTANLILVRKLSFERHKWSPIQTRTCVLHYAVAHEGFIATEFCSMFVMRSASWPFFDL